MSDQFIFFKWDSFGNDIEYVGPKPVYELMEIAQKNPNVVAFNTLGYLKNKLSVSLCSTSLFNETDGLYIIKNRIDSSLVSKFDNMLKNKHHQIITVDCHAGLGNKLFQIAFLLGLQSRFPHINILIDVKGYKKVHHETTDWSYFIRNLVGDFSTSISPLYISEPYNQPGKYIDYSRIIESGSDIYFKGYFLSEKYFKHCKSTILDQFSPPQDAISYITKKYPEMISNGMFVHVRRGDNNPTYIYYIPLFENGYMENAIQEFDSLPTKTMYVCSDDLEWCKTQSIFKNAIFVDENEIVTLWCMSLCRYGGIASYSTFSWWGLYLNQSPEKISIFPKRILTSDTMDMNDFIPEGFLIK